MWMSVLSVVIGQLKSILGSLSKVNHLKAVAEIKGTIAKNGIDYKPALLNMSLIECFI